MSWSDKTITASWIGHSTVLINFFGTWILTDPVLSERIGVRLLGFTLGPKRLVWPALRFEQFPRPDLILLSHAHMDHLDLPTLARFHPDVPVVMAKNTADIMDGMQFRAVSELDWGETLHIAGLELEALRVNHFGWRWPWESDRSKGNWGGRSFNAYMISKNGKSIFFGGDTALQNYFQKYDSGAKDIELAMMPIGAYRPWIRAHCNPEQAIEMAQQIGAKRIMPMHWGTFIQSDEPAHEPIERFTKALEGSPLTGTLTKHGETWSLEKSSSS